MSYPKVPLRPLGKDGPLVPRLGLGTMGMHHSYGEALSDEEVFKVLDKAYELGYRFWDTAALYDGSEEAIGKWFKRTGKRDDIFLATKFGFRRPIVDGKPVTERDASPEYCREICAQSLQRLGVESIDLFYMHIADEKTPIERTMEALAELKAQGKIKNIGLSFVSAVALRRAVKIAPVAALQVEYSLFMREIELTTGRPKDILSTCRELGVALVIATPLGRGIITSTYAEDKPLSAAGMDVRPLVLPRFLGENKVHNINLVKQLGEFAEKKKCTITQLVLAWLLKQDDLIFPIPGTKKVKYVEENFAALQVELSDEEEAELRKFAESVEIAGEGVPASAMDWIYSDTKPLDG